MREDNNPATLAEVFAANGVTVRETASGYRVASDLSAVVADTREHGGGTYDPVTLARVDFADGYVVATPWGIVVSDAARDEDRLQGIADVATNAREHGGRAYVGTWQDGERLHVDVVEHFADRASAIRWGVARGQISVWDCANGCEIRTGGSGSDNVIG